MLVPEVVFNPIEDQSDPVGPRRIGFGESNVEETATRALADPLESIPHVLPLSRFGIRVDEAIAEPGHRLGKGRVQLDEVDRKAEALGEVRGLPRS